MLIAGLVIGALIVGLVALTAVFTPSNSHPAYDVAAEFMNAAGQGDEATAFALLNSNLQTYARENCLNGEVSACIRGYTPPEWGSLLSAEFRRSLFDSDTAVDVLLFATYEEEKGFSGVCIYHRVEQDSEGHWKVAGWSGFISCGESGAGLQNLRSAADAPNRVP